MGKGRLTPHKFSYWWAALIGLAFPALEAGIYYFRFGRLNPYASPQDYALFFLGGALGGLLLITLWRRGRTGAARWIVLAAFLLATPFATLGMLGGGLFGSLGVPLLPLAIWTLFTGIGYGIGRLISRGAAQETEG